VGKKNPLKGMPLSDETNTKGSKGQFPTMGTSASRVRATEKQSPNVKNVRKNNSKGGSIPDAGTATNRSDVLERMGHKGAPQMSHVYPEAPEARALQRNVRLVPSSVGNRDFWDKRKYGQVQQ